MQKTQENKKTSQFRTVNISTIMLKPEAVKPVL